MEIIDFHIHPYLTEDENLCMYREALDLPFEDAIKDLEKAGITKFCGSVLNTKPYRIKDGFRPIDDLNQDALLLHERYKDCYVPGFHIHPEFVSESKAVLDMMKSRGFYLIGELCPYKAGWEEAGHDYGSKGLSKILSYAESLSDKFIVSFHTMNDEQDEMERMISEHPAITFVSAHPGQREDFLNHIKRLKKYENAYLDLSGTGLFRYGILAKAVSEGLTDRLLFGTDYPIVNPSMYVSAVKAERISAKARKAIFSENAKRLLFT